MPRTVLLLALVIGVTNACAKTDVADSDSAAPPKPDTATSLDPATWSDDQMAAYIGVVSSTLATARPTVEKRSRNTAVRTFARTVSTEHLALVHLTDSLAKGRPLVVPPAVSSATLRAYEREMRRLQQARAFDLAYVKIVEATLTDAQNQLARVDNSARSKASSRLLDRTRRVLHGELRTAKQLRRALQAVPATKTKQAAAGTKR